MNKHGYYPLLKHLKTQRNALIADFRHFKRDPVNRKWIPHSGFSNTVTAFRRKIAELDKLIAGGKLAVKVSRETGVIHYFDYDTNSIYSKGF